MGKSGIAGIIGWYGEGPRFAGGESDKIKSFQILCAFKYRQIVMASTDGWRKKTFSIIKQIKGVLRKSDDIFICVSTEGTKYLLPFIIFLNHIYKKRLFYVMVGIGTFKTEAPGVRFPNDYEVITRYVQDEKKWVLGNKKIAKYLSKMHCVFVETARLKRMCEKIYALTNVVVLNNFRPSSSSKKNDPNFLSSELKRTSFYPVRFVFFARVCPQKGIDDLIEAVNLLPSSCQGKFLIDIYGMVQDFAQDWFKGLKFPKDVFYKGVILADKASLLSSYDSLIFPTRYIEGTPGTIIDARFSSLPIVCSNFTFADELVYNGQDGLIYPYGDAKCLSETLLKIIQDPASLMEMKTKSGIRGSEFIEENLLPIFLDATT